MSDVMPRSDSVAFVSSRAAGQRDVDFDAGNTPYNALTNSYSSPGPGGYVLLWNIQDPMLMPIKHTTQSKTTASELSYNDE